MFRWKITKQLVQNKVQEPVHSIEIISQDLYTKDHLLEEFVLIAMASISKVIILVISPIFQSLLKFERPETRYIKTGALPFISWGNCSVLQNQDPVLAIGWGKKIYLIKVSDLQKKKQ